MIDQYIRQYGQRLYGLCRVLCASPTDADDLYQDTWLKALRHIDRYQPEKPFEPWLTSICVNTYRNRLRRIARSPVFDAFSSREEKDAFMEQAAVPEKEDYSSLHEAVDRLPEKLRLTVILFYFEDMDLISTAALLKVPVGTVKSRLHSARKKLREVLQNEKNI